MGADPPGAVRLAQNVSSALPRLAAARVPRAVDECRRRRVTAGEITMARRGWPGQSATRQPSQASLQGGACASVGAPTPAAVGQRPACNGLQRAAVGAPRRQSAPGSPRASTEALPSRKPPPADCNAKQTRYDAPQRCMQCNVQGFFFLPAPAKKQYTSAAVGGVAIVHRRACFNLPLKQVHAGMAMARVSAARPVSIPVQDDAIAASRGNINRPRHGFISSCLAGSRQVFYVVLRS